MPSALPTTLRVSAEWSRTVAPLGAQPCGTTPPGLAVGRSTRLIDKSARTWRTCRPWSVGARNAGARPDPVDPTVGAATAAGRGSAPRPAPTLTPAATRPNSPAPGRWARARHRPTPRRFPRIEALRWVAPPRPPPLPARSGCWSPARAPGPGPPRSSPHCTGCTPSTARRWSWCTAPARAARTPSPRPGAGAGVCRSSGIRPTGPPAAARAWPATPPWWPPAPTCVWRSSTTGHRAPRTAPSSPRPPASPPSGTPTRPVVGGALPVVAVLPGPLPTTPRPTCGNGRR